MLNSMKVILLEGGERWYLSPPVSQQAVQPRDADKGPEGAIAAAFRGAGVGEIAKMLWSF